ncbi:MULTISPECIES: MgtC/SapB family protein [Paenibacillus]|uniref:MgtC/SapB family protein n=1 Tax=Paenibacillus taichungensis TaxID=484184 RepID=A0A329QGF4_9BACL|nr:MULTISPECIES: MgtC/SapB family protein [Paenibacillus]RAW11390.1 MgtC/SapB family protein [Paenibacillus taichungensis]
MITFTSWVGNSVPFEYYVRILISAVLGLLIGFDRTHKNKPAGVKTYTFVTVASALITIVSIESVEVYGQLHNRTMMDPMRLAAQIVSGLGFLGAGLIMKAGFEVKGLTSAAMILFAGGVGIGTGAGFYGIVTFSMAVAFFFIRVGGWIEKWEHKKLVAKEEKKDLSA